jgi:membrane protease YdiL (CAAX protease family)
MTGSWPDEQRYPPPYPWPPPPFDPPSAQEIPEVLPVENEHIPQVEPVLIPSVEPAVFEGLTGVCWRCGKPVAQQVVQCPWCAAPLDSTFQGVSVALPRRRRWSLRALLAVLVGYAVILGSLIAGAVMVYLKAEKLGLFMPNGLPNPQNLDKFRDLELQYTVVASVVMALLVLATWVAAGKIRRLPNPSPGHRLTVWVLGPVLVLPALLLLNIGYTMLMQQLVSKETLEIMQRLERALAQVPLYCFLLTVPPAIFEELFFRYLALGAMYDALRGGGRNLALHLSVFLSGVMFGAAHLGQALAIPYLILVGVVLGYMRVASGGLLLPMLLHFLHNGAVVLLLRL